MKQDASSRLAEQEVAPASLPQKFGGRKYTREVVLAICSVLLIVLFATTAFVSRVYHQRIQALARDWSSRGTAAIQAGRLDEALAEFRNALVYSPNDKGIQLQLAQALAASGRLDEAESYFTNLLAESPGNGEINLELARIAARKNETVDAMRYYQSAVYGVWDADPLEQRWNVRREICEYLLRRGDLNDAQPEIIRLAQEVPASDLKRQKVTGEFFLSAQMWEKALIQFDSVLKFDPRDEEALARAGTAAFRLGRYADALHDFDKLSPEKKVEPQIGGIVRDTRAVVVADPWMNGISPAERARRTSAAVQQAASRAEDCAHRHGESVSALPPVSDLQKLYAKVKMAREWSEANLTRYPDRIDAAMAAAFEIEDASAQQCGEPQSEPDRVLRTIERSRERAGT